MQLRDDSEFELR